MQTKQFTEGSNVYYLCGTSRATEPEGQQTNEEKMRDEVEEYLKLSTVYHQS